MSSDQLPNDLSAIIWLKKTEDGLKKISRLYYATPGSGRIAYFESEEEGWEEKTRDESGQSYSNAETGVQYSTKEKRTDVYIATDKTSPAIAAVSYQVNGSQEIRVYYKSAAIKDEEDQLRYYLKEICLSSRVGTRYYDGDLSKAAGGKGFEIHKDSKISAAVDYLGDGQMKVYFRDVRNVTKVAFMPTKPKQGEVWKTRPLLI